MNNPNTAGQITLKALIIVAMILLLLIPVAMLTSMIHERMQYQSEVETEIGTTWGGPQTVTGPILCLPYERVEVEDDRRTTVRGMAYLLPETLDAAGTIDTEVRTRTAHKVLLYRSDLAFEGRFARPDIASLGLRPEEVRWDESTLYVGIASMQGVQSSLEVDWGGAVFGDAAPVVNEQLTGSGLAVRVPVMAETGEIPFRFGMQLNGTGSLLLTPVGKQTTARLESAWPTVSFTGNYLPAERELADGFLAEWNVFEFNRSYPQAWLDNRYTLGSDPGYEREKGGYDRSSPLLRSAFGADLRFALDHYQLSTRSVKYAVMFIALTFFVFFLVELLSGRRIHPIQYLLVAAGLILFYALLLALSEHIGFAAAYGASAAAIVGLISVYSISIFKKGEQALRMGLFLAALYVYLYVMLQLENMALLFGAIGLFIALAIIMYVSRKIDWYRTGDALPEK